jgi:HD-like signal output (HDOD) protein
MKQRSTLTAVQVTELHGFLDRKLEALGIESQPEIVLKLLDLSKNTNAQVREYANVVRTDHSITGRILKLANSAMFAQRTPVTNLERACAILGIERLKAVSLGIHLSRAANAKDAAVKEISRACWGESVFRACMAAEAAKYVAPGLSAEAFIVGLMMDAAIPLCAKIQGTGFVAVYGESGGPGKLYKREYDQLAFTHVDVVSVLAKKWRLPDLLTRPLELHHTRPADNAKDEPVTRLHRIAYVVGMLELNGQRLGETDLLTLGQAGGMMTAQRLLRLHDDDMGKLVAGSLNEYKVLCEVFSEFAATLPNLEDLASRVHNSLLVSIDQQIENSLLKESAVAAPLPSVQVGRSSLEFERQEDGCIVAYVTDAAGKRLVSHRLAKTDETPFSICENLGLEQPTATEAGNISQRVRVVAA